MTIPTFSKPSRGEAAATSSTSDEEIKRRWNFIQGLWAKALRLYGEGAAAGKMLVASDSDGNLVFSSTLPATTVALTGQTASQTSTLVASASGEYVATAYAQCTTAGLTGTLDVTFTVTDDVGSATLTAVSGLSLTATGRAQGLVVLRCAGGGIDYTATMTGATGSPQYALHISVTKVRA